MECYTIIANPGENANTEINISWHTDISNLNSKLIYTVYDDLKWEKAITIKGIYYLNDVFDGNYSITKDRKDIYERAIFLHYHVCLKNLMPNTKYMYKVGENEFSDVHYFKTGSTEFSFAWVSDFHAYLPLPNRLNSAFDTTEKVIEHEKNVDFIFCGGDAIAWGGSYSFWKDMYEKNLVKNYMWVNVLGNHDFMSRANHKNTSDYFKSTNYFPHNGYDGEIGSSYYFYYGNIIFIILNSEAMGFVLDSDEVQTCLNWIETVLENNKDKKAIICQHYDWFQGVTGASRKFGYLRYKELFDKYHVTLAMANNNHIYIRTYPLYQDEIKASGTVYIQSPSADNERGQICEPLAYNQDIIAKRFSEGNQTIGIIIVKVNEKRITITLYDRNIKVIDDTTIKL